MPVTGTRLVIAIMLTATWAKVQEKTPTVKRRASADSVNLATLRVRKSKAAKTTMTRNSPTKPKVSPMMAKTESLIDSGR